MKTCSLDGCTTKYFGNGLCAKHYFQERRAEQARINGPKDRKKRSDSFDGMIIDPEDFWQFVKKELKIQ